MANFDSKIFNAEVFGKYVDRIPNLKKNELIKSGALVSRQELASMLKEQTGGNYVTIPFKGLIDGVALNYDGQTNITSTGTKTYSQSVIVYGRAKAWTEKDFSQEMTGVNFMDNVAQQVANYWENVDQATLLAVLEGIYGMTGTENLKFVNNHTLDISADTDSKVGATTLNNAIQKACGDNKNVFSVAIMHSQVATNLENLQVLEYMKYNDANGIQRNLELAQWNGRLVLIDDSMPFDSVSGKYTTYILGANAFGTVNAGVKVPYEMDRNPAINGGEDTLYSRIRKSYIPYGISFTKNNMVSLSPTDTELKDGSNWTLVSATDGSVIDHKAIPIARIISLG